MWFVFNDARRQGVLLSPQGFVVATALNVLRTPALRFTPPQHKHTARDCLNWSDSHHKAHKREDYLLHGFVVVVVGVVFGFGAADAEMAGAEKTRVLGL